MLTHKPSTIAVFQTDQYKNFCMIPGNRGINISKVNKIIKEIEGGNDMLQYYPIQVRLVKDQLQILDGQHRFFISKKLKRPVYYILVHEEKDMTDIARVNSNVERWKHQNFINCYMQKGNKHYRQLQDFINKYKIPITVSMKLLAFGHPGVEGTNSTLNDKFETGKFEVLEYDKAVKIAEECLKFSSFKSYNDRGFIIAINKVMSLQKISMETLVEAFNRNPDMLQKQNSYKDYIINLEAIVNKGKSKRIVIT